MAPYADTGEIGDVENRIDLWSAPVEYCLSGGEQDFDNMCILYFNKMTMASVCGINLIQCFHILCAVKLQMKQKRLVLLGDFITSFLNKADITTQSAQLLARKDVAAGQPFWKDESRSWNKDGADAAQSFTQRKHWQEVVGLRQW